MMSVNGTLFVQMLHFAVAYWVLKQFLFLPIVQLIKHEQEVSNQLSLSIQQLQETLHSNDLASMHAWVHCREYLLLRRADQQKEQTLQHVIQEDKNVWNLDEIEISTAQINACAQELVGKIIKRDAS